MDCSEDKQIVLAYPSETKVRCVDFLFPVPAPRLPVFLCRLLKVILCHI